MAHGAGGREPRASAALILGDRDQLRRHLRRAWSRADGEIALQRDRLAGPAARALRRRGARDRVAPPPRAGGRRDRRRARARPGSGSTTSSTVAVTQRPGADRRAAGGAVVGEGAGRRARPAARAGGPPARARRGQHARPDPIEPPYLCLVASGGHTFLARVDDPAALHGARPDARRRRRRGVRQGRAPARARLPGRARARPAGARGRPRGVRLPAQRARASSTSASAGSRPRCSTACATWRAGRRARGRPRRLLPARDRGRARGARRERRSSARGWSGWRSAAAWRPTPSCARAVAALGVPVWVPPLELCTDNAAMIAGAARFLEPMAYPDYLALDAAARLWPQLSRRGLSASQPRLLEVEVALHPAPHLVGDLARGCAARSAPRAARRTART